jgi:hypothetical protein
MRITSKTAHDINKMEDNFALRYVFTYPGIISRAELVPSHGASRRRLGDDSGVFRLKLVLYNNMQDMLRLLNLNRHLSLSTDPHFLFSMVILSGHRVSQFTERGTIIIIMGITANMVI